MGEKIIILIDYQSLSQTKYYLIDKKNILYIENSYKPVDVNFDNKFYIFVVVKRD